MTIDNRTGPVLAGFPLAEKTRSKVIVSTGLMIGSVVMMGVVAFSSSRAQLSTALIALLPLFCFALFVRLLKPAELSIEGGELHYRYMRRHFSYDLSRIAYYDYARGKMTQMRLYDSNAAQVGETMVFGSGMDEREMEAAFRSVSVRPYASQ